MLSTHSVVLREQQEVSICWNPEFGSRTKTIFSVASSHGLQESRRGWAMTGALSRGKVRAYSPWGGPQPSRRRQPPACCHSLERLAGVWLSWNSKTTSLSKGDLSAEGLGYSAGRGLSVSIFDFSKQKCEASKCSDGVLFMGWAIKPTERLTSGLRVCPIKQNILQIIVWSYSTLNEAFHFGSNTVQGKG